MRLRINLSNRFLTYVYGVSISTVSRIITDVKGVMYVKMTPPVVWPERADQIVGMHSFNILFDQCKDFFFGWVP